MPRSSAARADGSDRTSIYQEITSRIIAELEAGRLPWVQPWGTSAVQAPLALPRNATTGRRYSGINVLILWGAVVQHGFSGQSWLTFRQALAVFVSLIGFPSAPRGWAKPACCRKAQDAETSGHGGDAEKAQTEEIG